MKWGILGEAKKLSQEGLLEELLLHLGEGEAHLSGSPLLGQTVKEHLCKGGSWGSTRVTLEETGDKLNDLGHLGA